MRKTKIVCTIGPATNSYDKIVDLLKAGMNVARLNMSHGDLSSHKKTLELVKQARQDLNLPCSIMVDTCGPELRIGTFENHKILLNKNDIFTFTTREVVGNQVQVNCPYPALLQSLKVGQKIYANNGLLEFVIKNVDNVQATCKVVIGGELSDHKSISVPKVRLPLPFISKKDEDNLLFAVKNDVEYISASFVSTESDVALLKNFISSHGGRQQIIAKIENVEGLSNFDKIMNLCDGIMVARGDMGTEIPIEQIPAVQKSMIAKCIANGKKVIVATEMLESMTYKIRPTRAETTDVAQAIYDKSGATMLSGETASGNYPIQACLTMSKIALATEKIINYDNEFVSSYKSVNKDLEAISYSACSTARVVGAKVIVCYTDKGKTADAISRFRPKANILAITHDNFTFNKLALSWGVYPVKTSEQPSLEDMLDFATKEVVRLKLAKTGDKIIVTLGIPTSKRGTTNAVHICQIN